MKIRNSMFVLLLMVSIVVASAKWENQSGPTGASASCILRVNDTLLYFGTFGGGLYRSHGIGAPWEFVNDEATTSTPKALNLHNGVLWLSSLLNGISISTDSGYHWTSKSSGLGSTAAWGCYAVGNRVYAITSNGLQFTTDNGDSWTISSEQTRGMEIYSFCNFGSRFIIGTNSVGIYTSDDAGNTWVQNPDIGNGIAIPGMFVLRDTIYASSGNGCMYISADSGRSWVKKATGLETSSLNNIVENNGKFYASSREGLYTSGDKCETWKKYDDPELQKSNWFVEILDGKVIVGSQIEGILWPGNSDTCWETWNKGLHNLNVNSFAELGNNIFVGSNISTISRSNNSGASWTNVRNGLPNNSVLTLGTDGDQLIASLYGFGLYYSANLGDEWLKRSDTNLIEYTSSIAHDNVFNSMLVGTQQNGIYASTNSGKDWEDINANLQDKSILQLYSSGNRIYAATTYGVYVLNYTIGSGFSWDILSPKVFGIGTNSISIHGNNIFVATEYGLAISHDGGANWIDIGSDQLGGRVNYVTTIGNTQFACTAKRGVFFSMNEGDTWFAKNEGLFTNSTRVICQAGDYVLLGTEGYGVFRAPLSDFVSATESPATNQSPSAYPLPCSSRLTITGIHSTGDIVTVSIINSLGETVSKTTSPLSDGEISIRTEFLPDGAYIALVTNSEGVSSVVKFVCAR